MEDLVSPDCPCKRKEEEKIRVNVEFNLELPGNSINYLLKLEELTTLAKGLDFKVASLRLNKW